MLPAMKLRGVKILVSGWSKRGPHGLFRVATTDTPTCKLLSGGAEVIMLVWCAECEDRGRLGDRGQTELLTADM